MKNPPNVLSTFLDELMSTYSERVEDVEKITSAMIQSGVIGNKSDIENDHIAFRTMGVQHLGIASLEKVFLHHGYTKMDYMCFEKKQLNAYWYAPPLPEFPRIFISELIVDELPQFAQDIIHQYTDQIEGDPVDDLDLDDAHDIAQFLHSPLWRLPTLAHYKILADVSEYGAWVIYNRYYLNHYTISVHNLPDGYNTMEGFVEFVRGLGLKLNKSNGVIKKSADGLLKQSSTMAGMITASFSDGERIEIPGSYVEFAERKVKPEFEGVEVELSDRQYRRDGFETANADSIFESTYTKAS